MVFYEDYGIIQWIVLIEKCIAGSFALYYLIKTSYFPFKQQTIQKKLDFTKFLASYLFYIVIVILNAVFEKVFRESLVGIAIWGLTIGNLTILKYSLNNFYIGDYTKNKTISFTMTSYIVIAILSSIAYTSVPLIFYGYENQDASLPIWVFFVTSPIIICYISILATSFSHLFKLYRKINTVLKIYLSPQNKKLLIRKTRFLLFAGMSLSITILFLYVDAFFSLRTLFAVIGWFFMSISFIFTYNAYIIGNEEIKNEKIENKEICG